MPRNTELSLIFEGQGVTDLLFSEADVSNMTLNELGNAVKAGFIESIIRHRILEDGPSDINDHFTQAVGAGYDPTRIAKIAIDHIGSGVQEDINLTTAWLIKSLESGASLTEIVASIQSDIKDHIDRSDILFAINEWGAAHPNQNL